MSADWLRSVEPGHPVFIVRRAARIYGGNTYEPAKVARVLPSFVETDDRHRRKFNRLYGTLRGDAYDASIVDGLDPDVVRAEAEWRALQALRAARLDVGNALDDMNKLPLTAEQCERILAVFRSVRDEHAAADTPRQARAAGVAVREIGRPSPAAGDRVPT